MKCLKRIQDRKRKTNNKLKENIIMPGKMKDKDMKGKKPMPMKKGGKKK